MVLAIAAFFRFHRLTVTPPGLHQDEAVNGNNALEAIRTAEYRVFYPENFGREGLFINLQALALILTGEREPWVLRLPSAIAGTMTVAGLYLLAAELYSARAALPAALFLACGFWHVNFSRIGFRAILAPLALVWGLYFLLRAKRGNAMAWSVLAGACFGAGVHSYIAFRIAPLMAVFPLARLRWKAAAAFCAAGMAVALPLVVYFARHEGAFLGRASSISVFIAGDTPAALLNSVGKTAGMLFFAGDGNWRHNIAGEPQLILPVAVMFVAGMAAALRRWREHAPILSALAITALPPALTIEDPPHALRGLMMVVPVYILAGLGGGAIWDAARRRIPAPICALATAVLMVFVAWKGYQDYFVRWAGNRETGRAFSSGMIDMVREMRRLPLETPKCVVLSPYPDMVEVRGFPIGAQPVMFLTGTFDPAEQTRQRIFYILGGQERLAPQGAAMFHLR